MCLHFAQDGLDHGDNVALDGHNPRFRRSPPLLEDIHRRHHWSGRLRVHPERCKWKFPGIGLSAVTDLLTPQILFLLCTLFMQVSSTYGFGQNIVELALDNVVAAMKMEMIGETFAVLGSSPKE